MKKKNFSHLLKGYTLLFIFLASCLQGWAQSSLVKYPDWTAEELEKANTAKNTNLTDEEKLVYLYCNLARLDGQRFAKTYAQPFLQQNSTFVSSLRTELSKTRNLPLLYPDPILSKTALSHATDLGEKGLMGHDSSNGDSFATRIRRAYKGNKIAENCAYSSENDALSFVMQLLVDDGVQSLGHRKNILNKDYNAMGVSVHRHTKYGFTLVQDFGDIISNQ